MNEFDDFFDRSARRNDVFDDNYLGAFLYRKTSATDIGAILDKAFKSLRAKTDFCPKVLLTLGSGLGNAIDGMDIIDIVDYRDIEGMPVSTVRGHKGRYLFGYISGVPTCVMQGRIHYYDCQVCRLYLSLFKYRS